MYWILQININFCFNKTLNSAINFHGNYQIKQRCPNIYVLGLVNMEMKTFHLNLLIISSILNTNIKKCIVLKI